MGVRGALVAVLVAVVVHVPASSQVEPTPIVLKRDVQGALDTMMALRERNERLNSDQELCKTEIQATEQWIKNGHGIDASERSRNKQALAGALANRIKGLQAFLGKLKAMRKRLRAHIIRINIAFSAKSKENKNAMAAAKAAAVNKGLHLLTLPAVEADDATAVDDSKSAEARAEEGAPAETNATVLLDEGSAPLSEMAHAKKMQAVADKLYAQVLTNVQVTRADLEVERGIFGVFRDRLRSMILKRESKLKKLQGQLKELNKAIASGGSFADDVWPLLQKHLDTIKGWQTTSAEMSKESTEMELRTIEAIRIGAAPARPASAGDTAGATKTGAPKADDPKADDATAASAVAPTEGNEGAGPETSLVASLAIQGYSAVTFHVGMRAYLAKALAAFLQVPVASVKVDGVTELKGEANAIKASVSVKTSKAAAVRKAFDSLSANGDDALLPKLTAAGVTLAEGVTVVEPAHPKDAGGDVDV